MEIPLISVVLTTYNRSHLLTRAINSVLQGSYSNFELIIIDDASSDKTPEVVGRQHDRRIQYVRMAENGGVLRARNRGFDIAKGDYITILDDDDELLPDALSTVTEEFGSSTHENIDVLWFDCLDVEANKISGSMPFSKGIVSFEDYLCGHIQGDFWLVFTKSALQGNRFNEELKAHESLLWLRIHRTHKARHVPRILCKKYREHGGEHLCDLNVRLKQIKYTTLALSQFISDFGEELKLICSMMYGRRLAYLGLHQMATGEFATGRSSILKSLKYRFSVKYALFFFLSFFLSKKQVAAIIAWIES